ncbi:hypothetical protein [Domibacillus tundrae]|uniref:hypothetical protein n=1 Tax=Domibacillus tundrae TaxID=1587527 RepID=UPI000B04D1ED|nr:hypothetical protein [Domibacillus tundrae]
MNWIDHIVGIYAGFDYPNVTPEKQAVIYECAYLAGVAATTPLDGVVTACQNGVGCPDALSADLLAANSILRETFLNVSRVQDCRMT